MDRAEDDEGYHRINRIITSAFWCKMRAKSETSKQEILSGLAEVRSAILDEAGQLSPEKQDTVFLGIWSIKDLLAHLAGWDEANLEAVKAVLAGKLPAFYAQMDKDWKSYNAALVAKYKREDFTELAALVCASQRRLIAFLETAPVESFSKDMGVRSHGYKVTIERLLQAELKDEKMHLEQIRDFKAKSK
ncbi:MAG: hypothetical protein A2Z03_07005 [Chloroflexi bacterium RBG_16_56_8]|nr:MAG: hypothetical protein A2Z03_07005 [Chloroflexi bacterium RBG_16_56_8]